MFLSLTSLIACGSSGTSKPEPIDLGDYDRTCVADMDCVLAMSGSVCRACEYDDGAINTKDEQAYKDDVAAAAALCPPMDGPVPPCAPDFHKAACQGGMCVAATLE
jgi:hypothetical protein